MEVFTHLVNGLRAKDIAELLEISHRALLYKIREYGIVAGRDSRVYAAYGRDNEQTPSPVTPMPVGSTLKAK
jgi:hypothetical protein